MKQARKTHRMAPCTPALLACALLFSATVVAQNALINGAFHGTVTDVSGAVIPGAKVLVKNLSNGLVRTVSTDSHGFYTITQLPPGHYSVTVSKAGFATAVQANVELLVNQDIEASYTLKVGQVTQQVQVTAAPPMLKTASGSLGTVVNTQQAVDLPLNGRQFTQLILLTPGAAPKEGGQQSFYEIPIGGGGISPGVNGQQGTQNNFTLDGILNNHFFIQAWAVSPPPDAIQEFNVQSHMDDAQYSISSGANVNVVTKSGGPQFHGDAWEFLRNSSLDAANFFDNFANEAKPEYRQNQYGFTLGGPVVLPGYDGRDKHTYFFGYWEGFRSYEGFTEFANVPTTPEENGDFADLLTGTQATSSTGQPLYDDLGRPIMNGAIYNPYSGRDVATGAVDPVTGLTATGSGIVRDPFPGNIIPTNMLNTDALTYLHDFYPKANYGPGGNSFPNFATVSPETITSEQFSVGVDHTFANNDSLDGKYYYSYPTEVAPNALLLGSNVNWNHAQMVSLAYTHIFSPTLISSFHFGYTNLNYQYSTQPAGQSVINSTGQAPIMDIQNGDFIAPEISLAPRLTSTDQFAIPQGPMRMHELTYDVQKVHGAHTMSAGLLYMHIHGYDNGWGTCEGFSQYPSSGITGAATNVTTTGDGLASMLLNLPSSLGSFFGLTGANLTTNWVGGYVQDKWQASKKLTLQMGLRWDFESPPHYLNNEFSMWNGNCPFGKYTTTQQIEHIEEACLLMPVSYFIPPTASNPTPLEWPTPNARSTLFDPRYDGWQPRFGFAYALRPRTVIRGAFAIFDDHNYYDEEAQDSRSSWPFGGETSFTSLNQGLIPTPTYTWSSPVSWESFLPPTSNTVTIGRATDPTEKIPYSMEYNFGVEHQFSSSLALDVNYVGSESRDLWGDVDYNAPFESNFGPNAIPNALPFPFIGGTIQGNFNIFPSNYSSLQVKVDKRFSQGLTFLASYTYSRCLDEFSGDYDTHPEYTYDLGLDYGPCDFNFPQLLTFSYTYQLPFGNGRHFASGVGRGTNALIGGWNIGGILSAQSGSSFSVFTNFDDANNGETDRANMVPGCKLLPAGFQQDVQHWYNTACFAVPPPYTLGDSSRNAFQGPDYLDFDFSLYKNFRLTESKTFQFRTDMFNLFNRPNFAPPGSGATGAFNALGGGTGTDVATPTFMEILGAAPAREIQFALKFLF
jgi:Carboxypeptidase regulatory-like domain